MEQESKYRTEMPQSGPVKVLRCDGYEQAARWIAAADTLRLPSHLVARVPSSSTQKMSYELRIYPDMVENREDR